MTLPWDELQPTQPDTAPDPPTPVLPPAPPVDAPAPVPTPPLSTLPGGDFGTLVHNELSEALEALWPSLKAQAVDYAKGSVSAILAGKTVDLTHPTVTATDMTGRELVIADAKSRSWRTLVQGLIFDVFAAIVAAVAMLSGLDPFAKQTWAAFGILLLKSVVSAVISYFMRLRITPTLKTEGEKYAIAPVPRPMIDEERNVA